MSKILMPLVALCLCITSSAQNIFKAQIKNKETLQPISSASVTITGNTAGVLSDSTGYFRLSNIPDGRQELRIASVGYETLHQSYTFPLTDTAIREILLHPHREEMDDIIVSSTRTSRTIANTPTRVETIELEEIDEKSNMRPANVAILLSESTGINVQQTSATSGNASIRMQGLDGRYTQILKDGYASFGNFANGLSILEIPPLDLRQVEVIKGPASTLYGAGAIAGVINFISKSPREKPELSAILNQSHIGQSNIGVFSSAKSNKAGYTMLGLYSRQKAFDADKDDFSEVPRSNNFTLHPRLFLYPSENTTISLGNSFTKGNMLGGDMQLISNGSSAAHSYFEKNETVRNTTTLDITSDINPSSRVVAKGAYTLFKRNIFIPAFDFAGTNYNLFTDVSYIRNFRNQTFIAGANFIKDRFKDQNAEHAQTLGFTTSTYGVYAQHTFDANETIKFENGLRADAVSYGNKLYKKHEVFLLPRVSVLFKWNNNWSSRIGGGLGYKTPTTFTERTETFQYQNLMPLKNVVAERSIGATADVNYKTHLAEELSFSINQMFFISRVNNSNILEQDATGNYYFINTNKKVISIGIETNARLVYKDFLKLFLGYTLTDTKAGYILNNNQFMPLVPKHKINSALIAEKHDNYKLGLEAYYTGIQFLYDGSATQPFWNLGFMAEKYFGKFSVYVNAENFLDTRQSRYKPVVSGSHTSPVFDDIWTLTEGRVLSAGIKFKL